MTGHHLQYPPLDPLDPLDPSDALVRGGQLPEAAVKIEERRSRSCFSNWQLMVDVPPFFSIFPLGGGKFHDISFDLLLSVWQYERWS